MTDAPGGVPPNPPQFPPFGVRSSERVYDSAWCSLRRDELLLPDGSTQEYHVFEVADAVCVLPVLADGSVVLIGQYRYPHGKTHWEAPAGRVDAGEAPEEAAARELEEETGYRPGRLVRMPGFYPVNGISAHYAHLFCALDCERAGEPRPGAAEQIVVRVFDWREARTLLAAGRLEDGFTALALMYYALLAREDP